MSLRSDFFRKLAFGGQPPGAGVMLPPLAKPDDYDERLAVLTRYMQPQPLTQQPSGPAIPVSFRPTAAPTQSPLPTGLGVHDHSAAMANAVKWPNIASVARGEFNLPISAGPGGDSGLPRPILLGQALRAAEQAAGEQRLQVLDDARNTRAEIQGHTGNFGV